MKSSLNQTTKQSGYKLKQPIGDVFTPLKWAKWAVTKFRIFEAWLDGAIICDPTAGTGNFLEALIKLALERRGPISKEMIERLYGIEKEEVLVNDFFTRIQTNYGISFPERNFVIEDILFLERDLKADILVGNPPWQNFADLPHDYKERIKPLFYRYGLVYDSQKLLLGSSRVDIAALVIAKTIQDNLNKSGSAFFFMPLSILLNEGAHKGFRSYKINCKAPPRQGGKPLCISHPRAGTSPAPTTMFAIKEVYDFKNYSVFESISTRYGFVHFKRDEQQVFPIPFAQFEQGKWVFKKALPIIDKDDPLTVVESDIQAKKFMELGKIIIPEESKPRQGVNTCGANEVFIFDKIFCGASRLGGSASGMIAHGSGDLSPIDPRLKSGRREKFKIGFYSDNLCWAINSKGKAIIPKQFIYPLVTKENFAEKSPTPRRFILLPYNQDNGKPLSAKELQLYPELWEYLISKKDILQKRKGTLINAWIRKGIWWALLGVGTYSFVPYKIIWESYGKEQFNPKLFGGFWQGNQAMHAYIPVFSVKDAQRILSKLQNQEIQSYLTSFQMEGTCNWAQPGRMKKLFNF